MVSPVPARFNPFAVTGREVGERAVDATLSSEPENGSESNSESDSGGGQGSKHSTACLAVESIDGVRQFTGSFGLDECSRLCPLLADGVEDQHPGVRCEVSFVLEPYVLESGDQHMMASGSLSSQFQLQCQRCLGNFEYPVESQFALVMVPDQDAADKLPEELDPVILDEHGMITLIELFEDELILQVPTVPKHTTADDCRFAVPVIVENGLEDRSSTEHVSDSADRKNPFAVLKGLKFDQ